ncbi:GlpG protein [Azotobacter beijerinckii]|uniref:GlpG protein n=1 Tax=Azotobacter beijerinckii TaxID=170623 RepID=A0A1H6WSJ0_9GAMM|nr:rhomboid family intramembrane serine protease [Azotobacter beijerinckii]SEJ18194.1 GlpG protein [Azotobacter beijerinckii]SEJ45165.1 GlpG protein [Azotobacter beijerinckii]
MNTAIEALRLPLGTDLSGFVALLRRLGVPHRVSEDGGEQVLWVLDPRLAQEVNLLYARFPEGDPQGLTPAAPRRAPGASGVFRQLRHSPLTSLMLLATLLVAALTLLGENLATVGWLSFQAFHIRGDYLYFVPLTESLAAGQWWRLLTPMLLHFGWLHLAMNSLWYWELGRRIEARQGSLMLLLLTLAFGLASNTAQYLFGGPGLFGGLSGVLYGLLGHCWIFHRLSPDAAYRLPPGVVVMMLVWLLVCLSGLVSALGLGAIANAAHVAGLLAGCLTGVIGGAWARRRG